MSDAVRRAIRTFLQGFVGILAILAIPALNIIITSVGSGEGFDLDVDFWRGIAVAALAGGVIALISWGQNVLEDRAGKAPLKEPPMRGASAKNDPMRPDTWTV